MGVRASGEVGTDDIPAQVGDTVVTESCAVPAVVAVRKDVSVSVDRIVVIVVGLGLVDCPVDQVMVETSDSVSGATADSVTHGTSETSMLVVSWVVVSVGHVLVDVDEICPGVVVVSASGSRSVASDVGVEAPVADTYAVMVVVASGQKYVVGSKTVVASTTVVGSTSVASATMTEVCSRIVVVTGFGPVLT